ncbi:MAG: pirin family protein [Candidatus Dadabacteria bacterium]|nr:pirin family protein [Candidatus Dadabacteria bacterium]NIQ16628.1 pirin family protein [Candidatus Dadabacteria bacterium]
MIKIRKNNERGNSYIGWLDSYHTFSFGNYYDPKQMGFGKLRVLNDDFVKGGGGFGSHSHKDMEIITYVIDGELKHQDNMGNSSILKTNDIQKMTAGTGIIHSEYNNSEKNDLHFIQIWILPDKTGYKPKYDQISLDKNDFSGKIKLIASGNKSTDKNTLKINQDVNLFLSVLEKEEINYKIEPDHKIWIQMIKGILNVNGNILQNGDGAGIANEDVLFLKADKFAEFLLFDLNGQGDINEH